MLLVSSCLFFACRTGDNARAKAENTEMDNGTPGYAWSMRQVSPDIVAAEQDIAVDGVYLYTPRRDAEQQVRRFGERSPKRFGTWAFDAVEPVYCNDTLAQLNLFSAQDELARFDVVGKKNADELTQVATAKFGKPQTHIERFPRAAEIDTADFLLYSWQVGYKTVRISIVSGTGSYRVKYSAYDTYLAENCGSGLRGIE
jgi:hypothetical protein